MSRAARLGFAVSAALAAFASLAGCGQRGPLTLSESQRPIQRLDQGAAQTTPPPPTGAPGAGTPTEPPPGGGPGTTPRPEDEEPKKR
ncbi:MAG TPA: lipoprotein [Gammaproteobacteria bacterium]|nr:lipoprotein [Gammaproteobacteria bacterium]